MVLPRAMVLMIDILIMIVSVLVMLFLWNSYSNSIIPSSQIMMMLPLLLFVNLVTFIFFKTFSGILRFSSFIDLSKIIYALTIGYGIFFIFANIFSLVGDNFTFHWEVVFLTYILNVVLMILSRIVVKEVYEVITDETSGSQNIFVYGTKLPAIRIAKSLLGNNEFNFKVSGFISDEDHMVGKNILGVRVHDTSEDLFRALEQHNIRKVIVSPHKLREIKDSKIGRAHV